MTGHSHLIEDQEVVSYTGKKIDDNKQQNILADYSEVTKDFVNLVHQEHDTIQIPRGKYRVIHQFEYSPKEIVRVSD